MKAPSLPGALLLGACVSAAVPAAEERYGALGTEPFWGLSIEHGQIRYDRDGETAFSVPAPAPRPIPGGRRYQTDRIMVTIVRSNACSDGMSDRVFEDEVTLVVAGETLHGCGGAILPPESLDQTGWAIVEIAGAAVRGENDDNYVLSFEGGRVSGQAGCNRFSGSYSQNGDRLAFGPLIATRMACPEPRMTHERRALQILGGPVRIAFPEGDKLVITGSGGAIRLERRI